MKSLRFILLIIVLVQQVDADDESAVITQKINDSWYKNSFFGFTVEKPQGWSSATFNAMRDSLKDLDTMFENNQEKLAHIVLPDWTSEKIIPLFHFSKFPPLPRPHVNPMIMAVADDSNFYIGIKTGCDYINASSKIRKLLQFQWKLIGRCHERKINGETFGTQTFEEKEPGLPLLKHTFYARRAKDNYILIFLLTYYNSQIKANLEGVMRSLNFEK